MKYFHKKIPTLSEEQIKKDVFVGPQIHKLIVNNELSGIQADVQLAA